MERDLQTKSMKTIWIRFVDEHKTMDGSVPERLCQAAEHVFYFIRPFQKVVSLLHVEEVFLQS